MGEPVETRSERISTGRAVDARPAMFPWSGGRGFTAERARMGESTNSWVHQPTKASMSMSMLVELLESVCEREG